MLWIESHAQTFFAVLDRCVMRPHLTYGYTKLRLQRIRTTVMSASHPRPQGLGNKAEHDTILFPLQPASGSSVPLHGSLQRMHQSGQHGRRNDTVSHQQLIMYTKHRAEHTCTFNNGDIDQAGARRGRSRNPRTGLWFFLAEKVRAKAES